MSSDGRPVALSGTGASELSTARVLASSAEFTDRVMATLADTPAPSPTRSFVLALRRRAPGNAARSLSVASHLVTVRTSPVAPRVRARSFALVLGVAFALGTGSVAAAAAVHQIVPLRLPGPAAIDVPNPDGGSRPTEDRPATPAPDVVVVGPGPSQVPGDDQAEPAASKAPGAAKTSRPHATPAVGRGGPSTSGHGGSGASSGSGGSADGDEDKTNDGAHDGGGSDDSAHDDGSDDSGHDGTDDRSATDDGQAGAGGDDATEHDHGADRTGSADGGKSGS